VWLTLESEILPRLAERLVTGGMLLLGIHESPPKSIPMLAQQRPWLYPTSEE
jgi:hypothetical protein